MKHVKRHALDQLADLKRRLEDQARHAAEQRAREAAAAARERAERNRFRDAVGAVAPLRDDARIEHARDAPSAHPRQSQRDERAALAATMSDDFDPASLLETDESLAFTRPGIGADVPARLRRGQWSIQRQLDLHGFTRDAARDALAAFVARAERDGLRCVRVVHGKGHGSPGREPVLKQRVRRWLAQRQEVIAFAGAAAADGGHGAVIVLLRGTAGAK